MDEGVVARHLAPKFLFKFHKPLSGSQADAVQEKWEGAARGGWPLQLGPDVDLYQLVDGRYVAVTAGEIVSERVDKAPLASFPNVSTIRERDVG